MNILKWFSKRPADFNIGGIARPYIRRWWIIPRNKYFNIYLHNMRRDDDDRALHDHPWSNISIVLRGGYIEVMPDFRHQRTPYTRLTDLGTVRKLRRPGQVILRRATDAHRLELPTVGGIKYSWSLFITGPSRRNWGFHCKQGFVPWQEFLDPKDTGLTGKGCGE